MTKIKSKILFLFLLILFGLINQLKVYSCGGYYIGEAYITESDIKKMKETSEFLTYPPNTSPSSVSIIITIISIFVYPIISLNTDLSLDHSHISLSNKTDVNFISRLFSIFFIRAF